MQAVPRAPDESPLELPEAFFARFGAVLVNGHGPVLCDPRQEIGVVFDSCLRERLLHFDSPGGRGEASHLLKRQRDGGSGPGADFGAADGGTDLFVSRLEPCPCESRAGQNCVSKGQTAPGFR